MLNARYFSRAARSRIPPPLLPFLQTGEFSARFLLKLPVDFSNIPVYLLKVIKRRSHSDSQARCPRAFFVLGERTHSWAAGGQCRVAFRGGRVCGGGGANFLRDVAGVRALFAWNTSARMGGDNGRVYSSDLQFLHVCVRVCACLCVCACVYAGLVSGGCELTNQQAVTLDLL